jgi:ABC-type polysaccharide/polyol phosphate export permease
MEIFSSLGLLIVIMVALNIMAGGRASSVLLPAMRLVEHLLAILIRTLFTVLGVIFKIGAGSIKLPGSINRKDRPAGPPPPRW